MSLIARSEDKLAAAAGPDALLTSGDLTDPALRRHVVARTLDRFGRIDVLVNNAAAGLYAPSWRAPLDTVRRMFELNLYAAVELIQLVVPQMKERRAGAIVNVSSIAGKVALPWLTLYSASKAALCSLGDGLRTELRPFGIQVTTVCPVYVQTGFSRHALDGNPPERLARQWKRAITAEQCAAAIARGIERGARTIMAPRVGWLLVAFDRLFPSLVDWQLGRIYSDLERAG